MIAPPLRAGAAQPPPAAVRPSRIPRPAAFIIHHSSFIIHHSALTPPPPAMKRLALLLPLLALAAMPAARAEDQLDLLLSDVPDPEVAEVMGDSEAIVVSNGWVVVDGELLHPPYRIFRNANAIKINDRLFGCRWPVYYWKPRTEPPRVPAGFPANAVWLFESDQGQDYWRDCVAYLRTVTTNADKPLAADDFLPFVRAIPAVSRAWTEEMNVIFENPITPQPKYLYIEWRADTNEAERLDILYHTTPKWNLAEKEARLLDNRIAKVSDVLRDGGIVLYLNREYYQLEDETAAKFISRMESMAAGTTPTNQMQTVLKAVFRGGEEIALTPLFLEHLDSYLEPRDNPRSGAPPPSVAPPPAPP